MSNELDLQDKTRMLDAYKDMSNIIDQIGKLSVFPPLVWVWTWDVVVDMYKNHEPGVDDEYVTAMPLEQAWELFWTQADKNGFTLEYGTEDCYEHIRDWMIDESIIVSLDEEEDDVLESDEEE
jgi:hypothetical protein